MCLAIPMVVIDKNDNEATVEAGGIRKNVRLDLLENVNRGDYVLVHTGFAIEKVDTREAEETLNLIREVYRAGLETKKR
jgi:hydrogenase expression/formation protein HypC